MLSIGKLAVGQADYYLDQALGSVTRAGSVSSGVEDYYLGGHEASGEWVGVASRGLGLGGEVDAVRLDRVLWGEHPASGEPLGRVVPRRVPGFDLTFSAPKSVSVLYGVGDDQLRAAIQGAHDRAVREALAYVDRHAGVTRRGAGGATVIAGRGLVAAAFRHRTSRAGDPQLHTHVLVANVILGSDGRWGTLDGRRIYAHAKAAGYLYELRLRAHLTHALGLDWSTVRNGIADVDGVPASVRRAFSRRRADIEAEIARRGTTTPAAAQVATLATRRAKDYRVSPAQLVPEWRERAAALGLDERAVRELLARAGERRIGDEDVERLFDRLGGPDGLTAQRSSFTRRDVVLGLCDGLPGGAAVTVEEIERLADRFLASGRAVVLAYRDRAERAGAIGADGQPLAAVPAERRYSTPELLAHERRVLEFAVTSRDDVGARIPKLAAERAIRSRPSMADEQCEMVRRLVAGHDGVAVVVGQAGTGKTYALAAAAEAWESMGREVFGAALARRAALELESGAGIPSTSLTALLDQLRRRSLPSRSVLVVDEAGMVPTRVLSELVEHVERARAKLVLVGDDRQLPEIGAGGAFRALAVRLPVIELRKNRRQPAAWEREALAVLRGGDSDEAIRRYQARGRIVSGEDAEGVRRQLVADWWRAGDVDGAVMIAHRRRDVADLNGRAHALMRASGALGSEEVGGFAVGDRVVMRRNDGRLGVVNGQRGRSSASTWRSEGSACGLMAAT